MVVVTLALGCAEPPGHRPDPRFVGELVGVNAPTDAGNAGQLGDEGEPDVDEDNGRVVIWPGAAALAGGLPRVKVGTVDPSAAASAGLGCRNLGPAAE